MRNKLPLPIIIALFLALIRIFLVNINSAEWGDSYRILRASNFVRQFSYPDDEKRPPLFSAFLAIRPESVDPVLWGRLFMLATSFGALFVFYKLCQYYIATENKRLFAVVLLFLNPVYLYWSLRIYADVFFSLLVLVCLYVFELWKNSLSGHKSKPTRYLIIMAVACGLSVLTRFEGYLLAFSVLVGLITVQGFGVSKAGRISVSLVKTAIPFIFMLLIVILPWLIYRNPLTSSYFEESAGRKYNLEMLLTYGASYLFVLGIIPAFALIGGVVFTKSRVDLSNLAKKYPHVVAFVVLESSLILAWPAAVPRLFVPVIPFLIVGLVKSLDYFDAPIQKERWRATAGSVILFGLYILIQNKLRLQFLGPHTLVFAAVSIFGLVSIFAVFIKSKRLFLMSAILSTSILAVSIIYLHKDVYRSIKEISVFSLRETAGKCGKVLHNDTASIVSWYIPESDYKNFDTKKYLTQDYLTENGADCLIITNEFDPNLEIDLAKRPYLSLLKESNSKRGGKMFFTWLVEIQK